jgi:hypothetical protein
MLDERFLRVIGWSSRGRWPLVYMVTGHGRVHDRSWSCSRPSSVECSTGTCHRHDMRQSSTRQSSASRRPATVEHVTIAHRARDCRPSSTRQSFGERRPATVEHVTAAGRALETGRHDDHHSRSMARHALVEPMTRPDRDRAIRWSRADLGRIINGLQPVGLTTCGGMGNVRGDATRTRNY